MTTAREATSHLAVLLRREHTAMAEFLVALAVFDRERQWEELGYASLFAFLRRELRLSAGAAQYRKTAAELIRKFPEVETALREGDLCLSTVVEVAKVITPENRREVLPRFFGLSRREAEAVAVSIRPVEAPPRREVVTTVRASPPATVSAMPLALLGTAQPAEVRPGETESPDGNRATAGAAECRPPGPAPRPDSSKPLDAESSRLHVTVSRRFLAKLEAARAALSHVSPGASAEQVLEAGLDLLLAQRAKRRGLVDKPRECRRPVKVDTIPAVVKREVWQRAGGRCEWRLDSGGVCGSTLRLELDHVVPRAHGGPSTTDNIRVACKFHNLLAARKAFGDAWMDGFLKMRSHGEPAPST